MKNKYFKIICFLLCFVISISSFVACSSSNTETNNSSKNDSSNISSENENNPDDSEEIIFEDTSDESYEDDFYGDYEDEYFEDEEDYQTLSVYNSQSPIIQNYRGTSGTIYHAFGFMKNDITGRVYTDEMMNIELSRLYDSGVRYCRTRFDSAWAWDAKNQGWNWESERMGYFYDYCKALAKQETSVLLNLGWDLPFIINGKSSTYEVSYLNGRDTNDLYGETKGYDMSKLSDDYKIYARAALRYGEWGAQALKAFKAHGVNNVSHILYFTEPSYGWDENPTGDYAEEYLFICKIIKDKLVKSGCADGIKHMGPNQGQIKTGEGLLRYILEREPDLFDVYSVHEYFDEISDPTNDVFWDVSYPIFDDYMRVMKEEGAISKGKEFWVDETDVSSKKENGELTAETAWCGLQAAVTAVTAQQAGISNILNWQFADQLWTDSTVTNDQFQNGIHISGAAPSLFMSTIPYGHYYTYNLFRKYNGYKNGKVYATSNGDHYGLYIGAVKLEDGSWTITVVNTNFEDTPFLIEFDKAINTTLYRHKQSANDVKANAKARLADVDKVYKNVKNKLYDVLPGGTIAIYTGLKR